jgi:hypothetical protein
MIRVDYLVGNVPRKAVGSTEPPSNPVNSLPNINDLTVSAAKRIVIGDSSWTGCQRL